MRGSTGSYIHSRVGALTFLTETGIRFPGNLTIIRWVLSERPKSATSSLGELGFYSSSIGASVIRGPWRDWEPLAD